MPSTRDPRSKASGSSPRSGASPKASRPAPARAQAAAQRELELHELREQFVEERARIVGDQRRGALAGARHEPSAPGEPGSDARRAEDWARLGVLEVALALFAEGTFGECVACREPIAVARLRDRPGARHCESCELSARHPGRG